MAVADIKDSINRKRIHISFAAKHHNGDQAARRSYMMCSICGCRFMTLLFAVGGDRDELIR